jgi:predicted NBD/HSP70 family sugar kinase
MGCEMNTGLRTSTQAAALRAVHGQPGLTRAQLAAGLGIPSGFAAETVARLAAARLVAERPAPATGRRGRPTTSLHAHPEGPLVAAAAIAHDTWQAAAVAIGGTKVAAVSRGHGQDRERVLGAVAAELERVRQRFGTRVWAASVAVPGPVVDRQLVSAPGLAWHDVDLSVLWPHDGTAAVLAGNDATLAGVAESRHGVGAGAGTVIYLHFDAGVGGALIAAGQAMRGVTGTAGEFGHMPFGDPARRCRCGARGCWNTSLDGRAVAGRLGEPVPDDDASYLRRVLARARAGQPGPRSAIQAVGRSLGRGIAGLVNGFDPHSVVVGGLGPGLLQVAAADVTASYREGLMTFRGTPPPPIIPARLGVDGPLLGAADAGFDRLLTDEGLREWAAR